MSVSVRSKLWCMCDVIARCILRSAVTEAAMTRATRALKALLVGRRVVVTSLLIVLTVHLLASYFGWPFGATAE